MNYNYCCPCCCNFFSDYYKKNNTIVDNHTKSNKKLFLSNGHDLIFPLRIEWANLNCAILSVLRFFLSEDDLLKKLRNGEKSNFNNVSNKKLFEFNFAFLSNYVETHKNIYSSTSFLIGKILNSKENKNYNYDIYNMIQNFDINSDDNDTNPQSIFSEFIKYFFFDDFYIIEKASQSNTQDLLNINMYINMTIKKKDYDYSYTSKYFLMYNYDSDKTNLEENITIKQENGQIKKYELIGSIWICGNFENQSLKGTDFVLLLPVFNKNKEKIGYVKYQFNNVSDVKSLEEWIKIDNFEKFSNTRPVVVIYKNIENQK
jgi:hypothetical protein